MGQPKLVGRLAASCRDPKYEEFKTHRFLASQITLSRTSCYSKIIANHQRQEEITNPRTRWVSRAASPVESNRSVLCESADSMDMQSSMVMSSTAGGMGSMAMGTQTAMSSAMPTATAAMSSSMDMDMGMGSCKISVKPPWTRPSSTSRPKPANRYQIEQMLWNWNTIDACKPPQYPIPRASDRLSGGESMVIC